MFKLKTKLEQPQGSINLYSSFHSHEITLLTLINVSYQQLMNILSAMSIH